MSDERKQAQCLDVFIKEVQEELTVGCQLPINIPRKELARIIKMAKKWFYKKYEYALKEKFFVLTRDLWDTDEFKQTRSVLLPDNVYSVYGVWECGREGLSQLSWNHLDTDFSIEKFISNDVYGQNSMVGISSQYLADYVIHESFYDMARQLLVNKLTFGYQRLTREFSFLGEVPKDHVVLEIYETIDDCSLFSDEIFHRYVVAQAKVQMSRVLGTFNYNLPGNIQINYDLIRGEGQEEIREIKEEIKTDEGADWFMTS
jgi:hypothetical protein